MKVGILTFFRLANFGANLQGYSTYKYLENNGYQPIFIDWEPIDFYCDKVEKAIKNPHGKEHFDFVDTFCEKTRRCITDEDICAVIEKEKIDAIIVGSDATLQHHPFFDRIVFPTKKFISYNAHPNSTVMFPNPFWGSFYKELKKKIPIVIMSACSQDSKFFYIWGREKARMKDALSQFSYISVRDDWSKKMVK